MHHFEMTADLNNIPLILISYDNDCDYVIVHKIYTILLLSMNLNLIYQTVAQWWPFPKVETTYKNGHTVHWKEYYKTQVQIPSYYLLFVDELY